jgi:hypothetical protein
MAIAETKALRAFPLLSREQIEILHDRFIENGFTDQRAMDAVDHVIDTHVYGRTPNIAAFISYDRRVKAFSWNELEKAHNEGSANKGDYGMVIIDGKVKHIKRDDIANFKFQEHKPVSAADTFAIPPIDMTAFHGLTVEKMISLALSKCEPEIEPETTEPQQT